MSANFQPQSDRCWTGLVIYLPFIKLSSSKLIKCIIHLFVFLHKEPTHVITDVDDKNTFKNTSLIISLKCEGETDELQRKLQHPVVD